MCLSPLAGFGEFLRSYIAPAQYTLVVPDAKAGTVSITERTTVIRRLLPLLTALDVAPQVTGDP